MKFSKKMLLASMFCTASVPAMAASVDIYGRADVSVQSSDKGDGRFTEMKSNASRLGFKGTHELSEDLTVVYKAEYEVAIDDGETNDEGDAFKARNQYIGLRGSFGEVLLGKNDTMLKQSQGKVDVFSDYNADIKSLWKGENRLNNTLSYKTPKFSGLQFGLTYMAEEDVDAEDALSAAIFYGDKKLKKSSVYAAVALDSDVKGYDTMRATVSGKISGITLGLILQNQENIDTGAEMDGIMVSAKYSFDDITLKGQYQAADHKDGDNRSGISAGLDYKLAKSTKVYAFYTSFDLDSGDDQDYLAAGIQYNF